jgi:tetratricopeptide (TPR) repeat protein
MIYKNLNKAQELDPNSYHFHYTNAVVAAWVEFEWEKSMDEFRIALELNPSHVRNRSFYSHLLIILRKTDDAVYQAKKALELDPLNPLTAGLYVGVLVSVGQCQEALDQVDTVFARWPDHPFKNLGGIYECLEEYDKAFELWKQKNFQLWEEYGVTQRYENTYREHGWQAVQEEAIRINEEIYAKDGKVHLPSQANRYISAGKYNKAMDCYEQIYENNNYDPNLPYISIKSTYDKMKDNPRYIALLKKMNLPVH